MLTLRMAANCSAFSTATTLTGSHLSTKLDSSSGSSLEASPCMLGSEWHSGAASFSASALHVLPGKGKSCGLLLYAFLVEASERMDQMWLIRCVVPVWAGPALSGWYKVQSRL